MNPLIKKAIAVSAVVFLVFIAYYGSYLPMRKSVIFIGTIQNTSAIKTIADFEQAFSVPLDYSSPIGQEELVRNSANTIVSSLQNIPEARGIDEMLGYIDKYYEPIVARGKGMSFGQDIYILGALHELAFIKTHQTGYLDIAQKYFEEGLRLGPKRPQALYGLLDVYRLRGNIASSTVIARQILNQWPTDTKARDVFKQLLTAGASSSTKK